MNVKIGIITVKMKIRKVLHQQNIKQNKKHIQCLYFSCFLKCKTHWGRHLSLKITTIQILKKTKQKQANKNIGIYNGVYFCVFSFSCAR